MTDFWDILGLGIPSGEVRNSAGNVVFPTNSLERMLQGADQSAQQYAAAFMGPGAKGPRPNITLIRAGGHSPSGGSGTYELRDAGGTLLGRANMVVDGNTGYVDNIYSGSRNPVLGNVEPSPNTLGAPVIREAMRQFLELNPEVTSLTGNRISGARYGGTFNPNEIGTRATINPNVAEIESLLRDLKNLPIPPSNPPIFE